MAGKRFKGRVVSTKMNKTVVIEIDMSKRHPVYEKIIKRNVRFKARDDFDVKVDDVVVIEECRPLSKEVSWKVVEVLTKEAKHD